MACIREIIVHDTDFLAAVYDKYTATFHEVITKTQTFSIYGFYMVVVRSNPLLYMFKYYSFYLYHTLE